MLRLGVVGTGIFATDSHLPALIENGDFEIVAATNRTKSKAEKFAETVKEATFAAQSPRVFDTVEELLNDKEVDVVDVLVPVQFNYEIAQKVIAAGKPLCMEKPLAANLSDARKIVELANSTDLPFMILENWIYHNSTAKLIELLPHIGKPASFLYQTTGPAGRNKYSNTTWRQNPEHVGGILSDGGVHDLALLTEVLGPAVSASAQATGLRQGMGDLDTMTSLLKLESGVFGSFTYAKAFGATKKQILFQIFGTEGSLTYHAIMGKPAKITAMIGKPESDFITRVYDLEPEKINGVVPEFANFADAVRAKDKTIIRATPAKSFHHFAIVVACVDSAKANGALQQIAQL